MYELTVEDAQAVVVSDQIRGKIWLTDTYGDNITSFITILVSDELTNQIIIQHPWVIVGRNKLVKAFPDPVA